MLGAIKAPTPPLQRIFNQLEDIRSPEPLTAAAVAGLSREPDPDSTHPSFGKRLAHLGFTDIPAIDRVQTSALDQVLSREAAKELPARLNDEWRKKAGEWLGVGR